MKRTTIPIIMVMAVLVLVAILAIPAVAAINGFSYNGNGNAPSNFQASFYKKTPNANPPPLMSTFAPGNKIPFPNDNLGTVVTTTPKPEQFSSNGNGNAKPLVQSYGNGNANCKANRNGNSNGKKIVKPTITVFGNKIPKNGNDLVS